MILLTQLDQKEIKYYNFVHHNKQMYLRTETIDNLNFRTIKWENNSEQYRILTINEETELETIYQQIKNNDATHD